VGSAIALLPDEQEQIVLSSNNETLVLTTKRVRFNSVVWGRSNLISITLDSVASCGLVTASYPLLALVSIISLLIGIAEGGTPTGSGITLLASVLAVAYLITRRVVLSIASNGGQVIKVPLRGMKHESVVAFIEAIEREKLR